MMNFVSITPISVNNAWRGRRFKTDEYKRYENALLWMLPQKELPKPPYTIHYEFGFSSTASDIDNPVKPFQDILCKKYGFNDKDIFYITVKKKVVKKGAEYVKFDILSYDKES